MIIPVALFKSETTYGVSVPGLKGCHSAGSTVEEAIKNVTEAIYSHMETAKAEGIPLKLESIDFEELMSVPEYEGALWVFVQLEEEKLNPKLVRVSICLADVDLKAIDDYVEERRWPSRSQFMAYAAMAFINTVTKIKE